MSSRRELLTNVDLGDSLLESDNFRRSVSTELEIKRMRKRVRYYFMSPCEKWTAKRVVPVKLTLQLLKIVFVTIQLVQFGNDRTSHVDFLQRTAVSLKHLFVKGWDVSYETLAYPPTTGTFSVYSHDDLLDAINFVAERYDAVGGGGNPAEVLVLNALSYANADGAYDNRPNVTMCIDWFAHGSIDPFVIDVAGRAQAGPFQKLVEAANQKRAKVRRDVSPTLSRLGSPSDSPTSNFTYGGRTVECWPLVALNGSYNVEALLAMHNRTLQCDALTLITLQFPLRTVHLRDVDPDCIELDVTIEFDNSDHSGQIPVKLDVDFEVTNCDVLDLHGVSRGYQTARLVIDGIVMVFCVLSIILNVRSIWKAYFLFKQVNRFFNTYYQQQMDRSDRVDFLNLWHVLIITTDVLVVCGTVFKVLIQCRMSEAYEPCSVLLGTGSLLTWFGVLRYFEYFAKYNILIVTMKRSVPPLARFIVAFLVFFLAASLCGWLVLGPYHIKFRTINSATECLFALLNGDDMFVTFSIIQPDPSVDNDQAFNLWLFSRIYLYTFISGFIYVGLNIFLAIIIGTYETIKREQGTVPDTVLWRFVLEGRSDRDEEFLGGELDDSMSDISDANSVIDVSIGSLSDKFARFCPCLKRNRTEQDESESDEDEDERQRLDDQASLLVRAGNSPRSDSARMPRNVRNDPNA